MRVRKKRRVNQNKELDIPRATAIKRLLGLKTFLKSMFNASSALVLGLRANFI